MLTTMVFIVGFVLLIRGIYGVDELVSVEHATVIYDGTPYNGSTLWSPSRVIDGVERGNADTCTCCTAISRPGWVEVILAKPYPISRLEIFGRTDSATDQSTNLQVKISLQSQENGHTCTATTQNGITTAILIPPLLAQYIRVIGSFMSETAPYMTICEIMAYSPKAYNIATDTASFNMSTAYNECKAPKAVNGARGTVNMDVTALCEACSATNDVLSWWQINFGQPILAQFITVYGRRGNHEDQSSNLHVYISNTSNYIGGKEVGTIIGSNATFGGMLYFGNNVFQYLTIQKEGIMTLCEVEIFHEECNEGTYGLLCAPCGHCFGNFHCNKTTGYCLIGCLPGWRGDKCDTECHKGKYGSNCTQTCSEHCVDPLACSNVDGACVGKCRPGYDFADATCNKECPRGKYGSNCTQTCSEHCVDPLACSNVDGACIGKCRPGYDFADSTCNKECKDGTYGLNCTETCSVQCTDSSPCNNVNGTCIGGACDLGWFGSNCSLQCHCQDNTPCNKVDGSCLHNQCAAGWTGVNCSSGCAVGFYGMNCTAECKCRHDSLCDHVYGNCSDNKCAAGWIMDNCSKACENGYFGLNCSSHCHCQEHAVCDHVSGNCSDIECSPGWTGHNCSIECKHGYFGKNCESQCRCNENALCNHINGHCSDNLCKDGWRNENCSIACAPGYYGTNCSIDCHCEICHNVNGSCALFATQCHVGFRLEGELCTTHNLPTTSDNDSKGVPLSAFIAVVVLLGIAVGTTILFATFYIKQRRKRPSGKENNAIVTSPSSLRSDEYDTISSRLQETNNYEGLQMETRTYYND